jgi:hypothetical protein
MSEAPDFIEPPRLVDMTPEQASDFLEGIRMRRLVAVHYYQEVQAERARNQRAELDRKFGVLETRLQSCITKIDEQLEKAEGYFGKLAHLKLESM